MHVAKMKHNSATRKGQTRLSTSRLREGRNDPLSCFYMASAGTGFNDGPTRRAKDDQARAKTSHLPTPPASSF